MASFGAWIKAARLRTLPLAVTCVLVGASVARFGEGELTQPDTRFYAVLGFALLTVIYLQVLANFANDYGDFKKGTDGPERSDRAMASGDITEREMKRALTSTSIKAFVAGCVTLGFAFNFNFSRVYGVLILGGLGVFAILAALRYTMGRKAYGYKGLGDVYVMLFFGYIGVLGVAYLFSHSFQISWLLPATFSGVMAAAVLNLNNLRDHENDARSGKNTLVVRMGFQNAKRYHLILMIGGWACMLAFLLGMGELEAWKGGIWYVIIALIHLKHLVFVMQNQDPKLLDQELKKIALSAFVVALFMILSVTA